MESVQAPNVSDAGELETEHGDGDEAAVLMLLERGQNTKLGVSLGADRTLGYVRMQEDDSETIEYKTSSIHFYAMLRSHEEGSLCQLSTLASLLTLAVQLILLHGFMFAYFVGTPNQIVTWENIVLQDAKGGVPEKLAIITATLVTPLVLLLKLESNKEFQQLFAFRVALQALFSSEASRTKPRGHLLFWSAVYTFRLMWVVPYMVFVNAAIQASTSSARLIIAMVFVVAYLLDLDDHVLQVFFSDGPSSASKTARGYSSVLMGQSTLDLCTGAHRRFSRVVVVTQFVLILVMKLHPWMLSLWSIPLIGLAFRALTARDFPSILSSCVMDVLFSEMFAVVWIFMMRCSLSPVCGEASHYFETESFSSTSFGSWLVSQLPS